MAQAQKQQAEKAIKSLEELIKWIDDVFKKSGMPTLTAKQEVSIFKLLKKAEIEKQNGEAAVIVSKAIKDFIEYNRGPLEALADKMAPEKDRKDSSPATKTRIAATTLRYIILPLEAAQGLEAVGWTDKKGTLKDECATEIERLRASLLDSIDKKLKPGFKLDRSKSFMLDDSGLIVCRIVKM